MPLTPELPDHWTQEQRAAIESLMPALEAVGAVRFKAIEPASFVRHMPCYEAAVWLAGEPDVDAMHTLGTTAEADRQRMPLNQQWSLFIERLRAMPEALTP
jgi:hypothetical protein